MPVGSIGRIRSRVLCVARTLAPAKLPRDLTGRRRNAVMATNAGLGAGPGGTSLRFNKAGRIQLATGSLPPFTANTAASGFALARATDLDDTKTLATTGGDGMHFQWALSYNAKGIAAANYYGIIGSPTVVQARRDLVFGFSWNVGADIRMYDGGRLSVAASPTRWSSRVPTPTSAGGQRWQRMVGDIMRCPPSGTARCPMQASCARREPPGRSSGRFGGGVGWGSAGQTYSESLTESATASDATSSSLTASAAAIKFAAAPDAPSSSQTAVGARAEQATAADSASAAIVVGASRSEAATASDAPGSTIVAGAG